MNRTTRTITECAVLIAIGTILAQIKLYPMPNGGSVTLVSMLPFLLISYRHPTKWALLSGFANAMLQMALGGVYPPPAGTFLALAGEILLDYVLAYLCLSFAGSFSKLFSKKQTAASVIAGSVLAMLLRFICSFLSGFLIWGSLTQSGWAAVIYSLSYNASYMIPDILLTAVAEAAMFKIYPKAFSC